MTTTVDEHVKFFFAVMRKGGWKVIEDPVEGDFLFLPREDEPGQTEQMRTECRKLRQLEGSLMMTPCTLDGVNGHRVPCMYIAHRLIEDLYQYVESQRLKILHQQRTE
jgi:hypothetical protein